MFKLNVLKGKTRAGGEVMTVDNVQQKPRSALQIQPARLNHSNSAMYSSFLAEVDIAQMRLCRGAAQWLHMIHAALQTAVRGSSAAAEKREHRHRSEEHVSCCVNPQLTAC